VFHREVGWSRVHVADVPFRDVDRARSALLKELGPPRQSYHPGVPSRAEGDGRSSAATADDGVSVFRALGPSTFVRMSIRPKYATARAKLLSVCRPVRATDMAFVA
jgi:hypothetical protein